MYEAFFGLRARPFDLSPDPRYLFLAERHREALSTLFYGLTTPKGLTLLLGEAGTGKTTLVRSTLSRVGTRPGRYVLISNPRLSRAEFYEYLAAGFGMSPEAAGSKTRFLLEFERLLRDGRDAGRPHAIVVDEAQSLPTDLLEEIRLLTNIETDTEKLLNVVLAGQTELSDRLNQPSLRQLKQRVTLRCTLAPLDFEETASYIAKRIRRAGGSPADIFTRGAVEVVYGAAGGIPRTINVLCDNAMLGGMAAQVKPVTSDVVMEVCRDFDLAAEGSEADLERADGHGDARPGGVEAPEALPLAPAAPPDADDDGAAPGPAVGRTEAPRRGDDMFTLYSRKRRFSFF